MQGKPHRIQTGIVAAGPRPSRRLRRRLFFEGPNIPRQGPAGACQFGPRLGERIILTFQLCEGLDQADEFAERVHECHKRRGSRFAVRDRLRKIGFDQPEETI